MNTPAPVVVDWRTWHDEREALLGREKAHTREGDAIAAARRRLPMTLVPEATLSNAKGSVALRDVFERREQLVVYKHMWHAGHPFEAQCEGCTLTSWNFQQRADSAYLNEQDISFAVFCDGPLSEIAPFVEFMGYTAPWYSTEGSADPFWNTDGSITCLLQRDGDVYLTYETTGRGVEPIMATLNLLDLTAYGRKESWEDSPAGWPQRGACSFWRSNGRPTAQWTRPDAGPVDAHAAHHH